MLSIAFRKTKGFVLQKMFGKVGGMFSKIKLDGESITIVMDSTSEKMYLCQVLPPFLFISRWIVQNCTIQRLIKRNGGSTKFLGLMINLRPGG
jgi:hypothetical protein